ILFIVFVLYYYDKQRQYIKPTQAFILEQKVIERTQDLEEQKNTIKKQFEQLQQINEELKQANIFQPDLQNLISINQIQEKTPIIQPKSVDEELLEKTIAFIHQNIDDSELDIEKISNYTNYSKTQFYRKIKAITGLTPIDVIRTTRLKVAEQLLKSGKYSVADVCYHVGFSDPKYFRKCFKEIYNLSPSDYMKKYS
ncbi:MAG TPA: helix-turn-helix domain-containing protein, partial [Bacteroidales bacterium]|nr:helix-turn-helix domain-containing protein [Bacteroidales bacterium]